MSSVLFHWRDREKKAGAYRLIRTHTELFVKEKVQQGIVRRGRQPKRDQYGRVGMGSR